MFIEASDKYTHFLLPAASSSRKMVPNIKRDLTRARIEIDPDKFLASAMLRSLQLTASIVASIAFLGFATEQTTMVLGALGGSPLLFAIGFFTFANYPKVRAKKISRQLEKDLPYALRHMLIEVRSGISLYEAMVSVSEDYGEASNEFNRIVKDINGGKPQVKALEDSILRNPSTQYRRAIWQMINALKSGTDMSNTLDTLVESMVKQQKLAVKRYGKELNPYVLMYLMIAVIVPSLGVTFMIVLSTFTGMGIGRFMFFQIIAGLILFQIFFLNFVKSKRPEVKT
ncbi:type II secretion system F family protein [Candidatus Nanohalococcus occultus]|uniref:type II secretion system F family protein n=1 Tax=Candidatus Nanohalococcus occultus TaxID=2978047 RepID=UPI0039E0B97B